MKNTICCFTGHRNIPDSKLVRIQKVLESELLKLIHRGVKYFGAGGALGFDTMAALTVLKLKREFPYIRLILVLPCKDQTKGWSAKDIKIYNQIRTEADKVVYISEKYFDGCMEKRNLHLVKHSGICIAYMENSKSGTSQTVRMAREQGLTLINLAEFF